jgi:hypothetical protein
MAVKKDYPYTRLKGMSVNGGITPLILNLDSRWRWMVIGIKAPITVRVFGPVFSRFSLDSVKREIEREKYLLSGILQWTLGFLAQSKGTLLTNIHRLQSQYK